ncbi:prepilin-type N-terminal cleavage/methylation domain-containing protein [Candidatus Dojkabacteria bacterium]|uniref:Prepilin-type N-terminal cleavage/methylation domain-containing protein n=1 Tax=Candidatus Dojkabacteria bacterium TaxID=2099670 RepID=A0A955L454_9BACT|nr:prepilin-type N-terminal cleavage/methylation domain-containing protein [Candidatus Dojkabacteria bacterium]
MKRSNQSGFTLVEILVVIALLALLAGAVFFALNPTQLFRDARNTTRRQDVDAVHSALRQYVLRDLDGDPAGLSDGCLSGGALPVIDVTDADPIGSAEGGPLTDLSTCLSSYIGEMPAAPGTSNYRWGVDDATTPVHVYVGVDTMEQDGDGNTPADYYLVY